MIHNKLLSKISTQIRCQNTYYPFLLVICIIGLLQNIIYCFHIYYISLIRSWIILIFLVFLFIILKLWYNDVFFLNKNILFISPKRTIFSNDIAFYFFLISEFMLFFWLFWSLFHYSWSPSFNIGWKWPAVGIEIIDWWGLSLFNTIVLISSSIMLNGIESKFNNTTKWKITFGFLWVILAGWLFLIAQYIEYSKLPFGIRDSVYSNIFYAITGLHLFHVSLGLILLSICLYESTNKNNYN